MRKKAIIEQNLLLFKQLEELRGENALKEKKIIALEEKVRELSEKPAPKAPEEQAVAKESVAAEEPVAEKPAEEPAAVADTPLKRLEKKVINSANLQPDVEYGASAIGELVMEAANGSNKLTAGGNTENRELVNLLLGKTEVAKAEILAIVSGGGDLADKKIKIDGVRDEALDYFGSVLAQID